MNLDFYNFIYPLHAFFTILIPFGFLNYFTYKFIKELRQREFTWLLLVTTLALNLFSFFMMQIDSTPYLLEVAFLFSYYTSYIALTVLLLKSIEVVFGLLMDGVLWLKEFISNILSALFRSLVLKPLQLFNLNLISLFFKFVWSGLKYMYQLFFTEPIQSLTSQQQLPLKVKTFKNPKQYKSIASGGEAHIYAVSKKSLAKIYKSNYATSEKLDTFQTLMDIPFPKSVVVPSAILHNEDGDFIGYEMPKAKGVELGLLFLPNGIIKNFPKYTLIDAVTLALSVLEIFHKINQESIIVGDINPRNILVEDKEKVSVIDTDSFQLNRPSGVGQPVYTHPKKIGQKYSSYMRTIKDDTFALSTIIFQILHYGALPYGSSDVDVLKSANYLYSPNSKNNSNVHPDLASAHHRLSLELKNYFYKQFHSLRYSPLQELYSALQSYKNTLAKK